MNELKGPSLMELIGAQLALLIAIALQIVVWQINHHVLYIAQYVIIIIEIILALLLGFSSSLKKLRYRSLQHATATILISLITVANFSSLVVVIYALITSDTANGIELLSSAGAIFVTNIIVYALWYWEIDSPALTNHRWSKNDKDFQFTQQDMPQEFPAWRPEFADYLFISIINSVNGATAGAQPLTKQAKALMATQALISIFTLALVIARSVSILG